MLLGTTYAWFTDSVTSTGNIIKTGTLDVAMSYADGSEDPATAQWKDASEVAIFDYKNWEPGYVAARHLKIENKGSLALNWQLRIVANGVVSKLADVIDVYYLTGADVKALTRADVAGLTPLGTLTEILGTNNNISKTAVGQLKAGDSATVVTLVLKMQEDAGNEYQNLEFTSDFSVQLIATQMADENDSFGNDYDSEIAVPSPEAPAALVRPLEELNINVGANSEYGNYAGQLLLNAGYKFEPTELSAEMSQYKHWHADFVVSADRNVPADSIILAGYYSAYCDLLNNGNWVALTSSDAVTAGTEIRLVQAMAGGAINVTYKDLCEYGNDGKGFQCGVAALNPSALAGTTLTVELRMYETEGNWDDVSHNATEVGPDAYITIGTFTYTFPYPAVEVTSVTNDAELAEALPNGKTNLSLANGTYHMPAVAQGKIFTVSSASGNAEDVIIEVVPTGAGESGGQLDYSLDGSNVCFNKVTVKTNSRLYAGFARLEATYNNCIIQNTFNLATGKAVFNNCEFNITNEYIRVNGASKAEFNGCTFNTDGRAILVFQDGTSVAQEVIVKDCTFNATAAAHTWNGIHVAAVSYDGSQGGTYTVTFEGNNVVDSDFNGLWQIKAGEANVTVNGLN